MLSSVPPHPGDRGRDGIRLRDQEGRRRQRYLLTAHRSSYGNRPDLPAVSRGRRNTSLEIGVVEEVAVGHGDYERLTPEAIDQVWVRLRNGQAAKPTARELGLCTGTVRAYLLRCGGIRPEPRRRSAGRLGIAEREEISRGLAAGRSIRAIAAALRRAPSTVSREVNANGGPRAVSGRACRPSGVGSSSPSEGVQARRWSEAACHRGGQLQHRWSP